MQRPRIELLLTGELTARILNTGNAATGELTLALSGANAAVFTLPQATVSSLPAGGETEINSGLEQGTYTAMLTVNGKGIASVSVVIVYTVTDTGNNNPQASGFKAYVKNGILHVGGLTAGQTLSVYNMSGALLHQSKAIGDEAEVRLSVRGVYVVTSGNAVVKVIY